MSCATQPLWNCCRVGLIEQSLRFGSGTNRWKLLKIYLDADLALKEEAMAKTNPVKGTPKRFQPDDELLAFLKKL